MNREYLEQHGWKLLGSRKVGCMRVIRWQDPHTGKAHCQGEAVIIEEMRQKGRTCC